MGLNLETLIGILVILIVVIFFDGVRRLLRERRNRLSMKIDPRYRGIGDDWDEEDEPHPELLSKARPARARDSSADVPVMMEAADSGTPRTLPENQQDLFASEGDTPGPVTAQAEPKQTPENAPESPSADTVSSPRTQRKPVPAAPAEAEPTPDSTPDHPVPEAGASDSKPGEKSTPKGEGKDALVDVIVCHVMAPRGEPFNGRSLLAHLLQNGMRYGEMNIFHYHLESGARPLQFSMANAVNPGTFDLDTMSDLTFPGVTFFMKMPGPAQPMSALEKMLDVARTLATQLGGEVRDEEHSVLTPQTMEHLRNQVQDFERRQRLAAR